ncbi:MAG: hypothetical protein WB988_17500 [Candidatus Nitrosopolaris sp.]
MSLTVEGIAKSGSKFFIIHSFPRIPILQTIPFGAAVCMESSSVTVPINSRTQLTPLSLGKSCFTSGGI